MNFLDTRELLDVAGEEHDRRVDGVADTDDHWTAIGNRHRKDG